MPRDGVFTRIAGRSAEVVRGLDRNHIGHSSLLLCRSDRYPPRSGQADSNRDPDCLVHPSATHPRSQCDAYLHSQCDLYCHEHSVRAGDLDSDLHGDSDSDPDSDAVHYAKPDSHRLGHSDGRTDPYPDRHTDRGTDA